MPAASPFLTRRSKKRMSAAALFVDMGPPGCASLLS